MKTYFMVAAAFICCQSADAEYDYYSLTNKYLVAEYVAARTLVPLPSNSEISEMVFAVTNGAYPLTAGVIRSLSKLIAANRSRYDESEVKRVGYNFLTNALCLPDTHQFIVPHGGGYIKQDLVRAALYAPGFHSDIAKDFGVACCIADHVGAIPVVADEDIEPFADTNNVCVWNENLLGAAPENRRMWFHSAKKAQSHWQWYRDVCVDYLLRIPVEKVWTRTLDPDTLESLKTNIVIRAHLDPKEAKRVLESRQHR